MAGKVTDRSAALNQALIAHVHRGGTLKAFAADHQICLGQVYMRFQRLGCKTIALTADELRDLELRRLAYARYEKPASV